MFNYSSPLRRCMRCTRCGECCQDTRMELCEADVARLERAGYARDEFSSQGPDGIRRLRNADGHCLFYDPASKRCKEYARRPLGCVIYPVNMSPDGGVLVDELCPEAHTVTRAELEDRGKRLRMLIDTIRTESRRP